MYKSLEVLLVTGGYFSILFFAAYYAEHRERKGASVVANPYVYSLSLAVYCTSWTFYGSVGKAAVSGLSFLTIYIGPTLGAALWWIFLRKILTIAKEHRITTIADFIGSRYGNSILLAGIVTVVAAIGITPYIGLQLKAIVRTFSIVSGSGTENMAAGFVLTLIIALFADIFCVRRQEVSEKHEGIVMAVAIESIVKLGAFLALGIYVTYVLFNGFGDILGRAREAGLHNLLALGTSGAVSYTEWASLTLLSMMAVMFLPRQFHVTVVENYDIDHLSKAVWLFPLYLLLINLFVLPVALGGLLLGKGVHTADTFGLTIPLGEGARSLALIVFLGGFSAASGMIIVESMAISNMVMNSIVSPAIWRFNRMRGFSFLFLNIKRLIIMGSVLAGYLFAVTVGTYFSLVDLGLISFVAVTIFAPATLFGLYWKRGNRNGALAGILGGFAVWCYTLIFPAFVTAGIIENSGVTAYLLQSEFLDPSALFGVKGLDRWSNALFWGLLVNTGLYLSMSLLTRQSPEEERTALAFVDSYAPEMLSARGSVKEIEEILGEFVGHREAAMHMGRFIDAQKINPYSPSMEDLRQLQGEAKRILSGILGTSIARLVLDDRFAYTDQERVELLSTIKEMNTTLRLSRKELAGANRQLAMLKDFSESIVESLPVGVATLDRSLRVTSWNRSMEKITGAVKSEAMGLPAPSALSFLPGGMLADPGGEGDFRCRLHGAELQGHINVLTGASPGYVVVVEDVTEKKRIEEELFQATKHASVGRLAAGVAHEVGNPLASISSLVQELQAEDQSEFTRESMGTINHHVARIARILRRLGDFARITPHQRVEADVWETLESTIKLVQYDKNFKKINIITKISDVPPVRMDTDQVQQVFLNLILNARDAMPDGGDLRIEVGERDGEAQIIFTDTGGGIRPEIVDKIFDPFFTTKEPSRGTGLGLGISYGIIEDHGGTIEVKEGVEGGARFVIRIPLAAGTAAAPPGKTG